MARRTAAAGVTVPGVRDALAEQCRRFADWWDSERFGALADALDRGDPVTVNAGTIMHALFRADHPDAAAFLHDETRYTLAGDVLTPA